MARSEFKRRLPRLSGQDGKLRLKAIRVTRHKPGRRCAEVPLIVSGTITDASGRTLSGQTTEAFTTRCAMRSHWSVGLNCALGAKEPAAVRRGDVDRRRDPHLLLSERGAAECVRRATTTRPNRWLITSASGRAPACSTSRAAVAARRRPTSPRSRQPCVTMPPPGRFRSARTTCASPASSR